MLLLCLSTGYLLEAFNFESATSNKTNCQRWTYKKKGMLSIYSKQNNNNLTVVIKYGGICLPYNMKWENVFNDFINAC